MSKGKKKRRPPQPAEGATQPNPPRGQRAPKGAERDTRLLSRMPKPETPVGKALELVVIVAVALGAALAIQAWIVKPFRVPSESMEPTYLVGQRILADRLTYRFRDPKVGDVVVFHPPTAADERSSTRKCAVGHSPAEPCARSIPERSDQYYLKRIVAGPGDSVRIIRGLAIVNGKVDPVANSAAENDFTFSECGEPLAPSKWKDVRPDGYCNLTKPVTVPNGYYFMMGDRRGESIDSRYWGPVPRDWIVGKVFATYWPPSRWGF